MLDHLRSPIAFLSILLLTAPLAASPTVERGVAERGIAERGIVIPAGTAIYAELTSPVTSRKRDISIGEIVHARVTDDVVIDREVVIAAGTDMKLRVVHAQKARFLGRRGRLTLEAMSVRAVDGSALPLTGGYYRSGKGRKAATAALTVAVAWPFLFLRGKNARLAAGTVIAAALQDDTHVRTAASVPAW